MSGEEARWGSGGRGGGDGACSRGRNGSRSAGGGRRACSGVHVGFKGDPVLVLRHLSGQQPMLPIPSIDASDHVDLFDRVQLPIQGFF